MKVLVTGGAGYIGTHIAVELLEAGHEVSIVDNFLNSSPEAVERVEKLTGKRISLHAVDCADRDAMDKVFAAEKFDAVIHCAGHKAVGESVAKPLMYYRNNIDSTLTLLEMMEKYGCGKIIFSSSATVYGEPESLPIDENAKSGRCSNPYGWTKAMIEQILRDAALAAGKNRDSAYKLNVILLRYFNPIGAHPSGCIGEDPNGIPNNLMPYIVAVAMGKQDHLTVFGDDYPTKDGTGVRDYIHVTDLAKGHVAALEYDFDGVDVINLGTGVGYSVMELINTFERVNGIKIPYVVGSRRAGDLPEYYSDSTKAREVLGWTAQYGIDEMCRDSWNWVKSLI